MRVTLLDGTPTEIHEFLGLHNLALQVPIAIDGDGGNGAAHDQDGEKTIGLNTLRDRQLQILREVWPRIQPMARKLLAEIATAGDEGYAFDDLDNWAGINAKARSGYMASLGHQWGPYQQQAPEVVKRDWAARRFYMDAHIRDLILQLASRHP